MADEYTSFPNSVQTFDIKSDISTGTYNNYVTYNSYIASGDFINATTLLASDTELQKAVFTADEFNKMSKTVQAIEEFVLNEIQTYIHQVVVNRGTYSPTAKYTKYNFVSFEVDGVMQTFECLDDNTPIGAPPTNTTYWVSRVIRGAKGEAGLGLAYKGEWQISITYPKDSWVLYDGKWWVALQANTGVMPPEDTVVWEDITSFQAVNLYYDNSESMLIGDNVQLAIDQLKNMVDGKAPSSHSHPYAGANTPGGAANSAVTATRATQDSAGRQIDTTYATKSELSSGLGSKVSSGSTPSLTGIELSSSTPFIDFHYNNSGYDYTSRIIETASGVLKKEGYPTGTDQLTSQLRPVALTQSDPTPGTNSGFPNGTILCVYE